MPQTTQDPRLAALASPAAKRQSQPQESGPAGRGFGGSPSKRAAAKAGRKRSPGLSKGDWGPLGKHPDLEAIVARQRLQLPLSGRLSAAQVNLAWKRSAAEHHPDRGGHHNTMQQVNGARDLLLGRDQD